MKSVARSVVIRGTYRRIVIAPVLRRPVVIPVHATLFERVKSGDAMADYTDIVTSMRLIRPIEINGEMWKRYNTTSYPVSLAQLFPRMSRRDGDFLESLTSSLFYAHQKLKNVTYYELGRDVLCCRWIPVHRVGDARDFHARGSIYAVHAINGHPLETPTGVRNVATEWSDDPVTHLFRQCVWPQKHGDEL